MPRPSDPWTRYIRNNGQWLAQEVNIEPDQADRSGEPKSHHEEAVACVPNRVAAASPVLLDAARAVDRELRSLMESVGYRAEAHWLGPPCHKMQDAVRGAMASIDAEPEPPVGDGWAEVMLYGDRYRYYRYQWDGAEHANPSAGLLLQSYRAGEWRDVRSWAVRDAFTLGWLAAGATVGE